MANITVRPIRDDEWREVRALRLQALRDDAAAIAFVDTVDEASLRPDEFWRQRTSAASAEAGQDAKARQFVAVTEGGVWVGAVSVFIERVGERDFEGQEIHTSGGMVVGVYLEPEFRGAGTIDRLFTAALGWLRECGLKRARLYVHADNVRAQKAYERVGFRPTGLTIAGATGRESELAREV